jgi:hypothetical protein
LAIGPNFLPDGRNAPSGFLAAPMALVPINLEQRLDLAGLVLEQCPHRRTLRTINTTRDLWPPI